MYDVEGIIQNTLIPELMVTHFVKPLEQLMSIGTEDTQIYSGKTIDKEIQVGYTGTSSNYDRGDVNPEAGTPEFVKASWTKIYSHGAAEVHGIDRSQIERMGYQALKNLLRKSVIDAFADLNGLLYENCYAAMIIDLLNSGGYSNAGINRTTYPTLGVYNNLADEEITLAHIQEAMYQAMLNQKGVSVGQYNWAMSPSVNYKFQQKAGQLLTWNAENKGNKPVDGGYAPQATFQGANIREIQGMTVGDAMFLRKQDVLFQRHRTFETEIVPSGKDSKKVILRTGLNVRIEHPKRQALLRNKD